MQGNLELAKKLNRWAWVVSAVVLLLVGMMRRVKIDLPAGWDLSFLPGFHAGINALTAITLILALVFIKQKNVVAHSRLIYLAMGLSLLFLLSYVAYHFTNPETLFGDADRNGVLSPEELAMVGSARTTYLILLLTHIVLAAVSLPLILFTFIRGFTGQVEKHRSMAKWVYPLWLYVAVTGPVCYWLLRPYY